MKQDTNIPESEDSSKNYNLKSEAVESLLSEDIPQYTQEELNKYRRGRGFHIPDAVKILFVKFWFSAMVCYFVIWGLSGSMGGIDIVIIPGIVLGMVTDLLTNNVIRFIEPVPGQNNKWLAITVRRTLGLAINIVYGVLLMFCEYQVYVKINEFLNIAYATDDVIYLAIEPILFGLLYMGFDMLFIAMKRLFLRILSDAKTAAGAR